MLVLASELDLVMAERRSYVISMSGNNTCKLNFILTASLTPLARLPACPLARLSGAGNLRFVCFPFKRFANCRWSTKYQYQASPPYLHIKKSKDIGSVDSTLILTALTAAVSAETLTIKIKYHGTTIR